MSINILKIDDIIERFLQNKQKGENPTFTYIDFWFYGYMMGQNSHHRDQIVLSDALFLKISYLNQLQTTGLIDYNKKLKIFQEVMRNPFDKMENIIDNEIDLNLGVNNVNLKKIESMEEKKLSEDYILKIMKEEELNKEENRKKKEKELEKNVNCLICLSPLYDENEDIWGLINCQHVFHRSCLNSYLKNLISSRTFPMKCPMGDCKSEVICEDVTENLDQEDVDKFMDFSLKNYVDRHGDEMSWCPTPNCTYAFVYDIVDNVLNCPLCVKKYCLSCRVNYHEGMTCKEYKINNNFSKDDEKFINFVKGQKFKQCVKCKFWVEKNEGCDHMTCRCGHQFCYVCGGIYQQCECVRKPPPPPPIHRNKPAPFPYSQPPGKRNLKKK